MTNNAIGGRGFHHVAIDTRDYDASVAFYRDGLGFPEVRTFRFGAAGQRAAMLDTGNGGLMEIFERPESSGGTGVIIHFAIHVDDVSTAHATALAAGATEKVAPKEIEINSDPPFPVTISFVTGPDGEEIEFFQER